MKKYEKLLLILIFILALVLRFYKLGEIPAGIHMDEESHGYNAYSIIETGKDRYGKSFPILFRSFGSYQPPVYTYLTLLPVYIFGNTIFAARFISALSGVLLVAVAYFFSLNLFNTKHKRKIALISALLIAIAPWSIFYSRHTAEGNLGVTVFLLSMLIFLISIKKPRFFPLACFILGISTHSYYSERIIAMLFLPIFIFLNRKIYWHKNRKFLFMGLSLFVLTMIPHMLIARTGALTRRLDQVGYLGNLPVVQEFVKKYLIYFSPRNLFFDTGEELRRLSPEMGVFYSVLILPFFLGLKYLHKYISKKGRQILALLLVIIPIPAALTGDKFWPLRALNLFPLIGLIISLGVFVLFNRLSKFSRKLSIAAALTVLIMFLFSFYISFFILFKYQRAKYYGYSYVKLIQQLDEYKDYKIIIDSTRDPGIGLRVAYLTSYDPKKIQEQLTEQLETPYYSGEVNADEIYIVDNVEVRTIDWGEACEENLLIVGDPLAISDEQAEEHNLNLEFEIQDMTGEVALLGYSTNPIKKCD